MDPAAPGTVKGLISRHGFWIKKSLGQNFLVDGNIVRKIVTATDPLPGETVVEIGPGLGALTRLLAERAKRVIAVEIDGALFPVLGETLAGLDNVILVEQDALKTDFNRLVHEISGGENKKYKVAANLPYYITTPLLMHLLEERFSISTIVVMVQEEVARRLTAAPGSGEYGAVTVATNFYARTRMLFRVPRPVFIPRPEVDSAVVRLEVRDTPAVSVADEQHFFTLVRAAFQQRRKTLLNALSGVDEHLSRGKWLDIFRHADIDPRRRGETLDLQEFARLVNVFSSVLTEEPD